MQAIFSQAVKSLIPCAIACALAACGSDSSSNDTQENPQNLTPAPIEIAGTWENADFAETDTITNTSWQMAYAGFSPTENVILSYDNRTNVAILKNTVAVTDSAPSVTTFSRIVWIDIGSDGTFYYCTTSFGHQTQAGAEQAIITPDASHPDASGCGASDLSPGFPWTKLTPKASGGPAN